MKKKVFSNYQLRLQASLLLAFCLWSICSYGAIRYVKPVQSGSGDGSSWANASANLQAMINASGAGDEVWVAAGTYKPTTGTDRTIAFQMKNNVGIYGGFFGNETLRSQRDYLTYVTTLSGDLNGDDVVSGSGVSLQISNNGENSYHVINNSFTSGAPLTSSAIIDGFTIRGGSNQISLLGPYNAGGGMYNVYASPTLNNIIFYGNRAEYGGGGLMNSLNCSPVLTNVTFLQNFSQNNGGGMYCYTGANPVLNNVTFTGNFCYGSFGGGAIANFENAPVFNNCRFSNNFSSVAGAISNVGVSATFTNCSFTNNSVFQTAGCMFIEASALNFYNCLFSGNRALGLYAGAFFVRSSAVNATNCVFWENSAGSSSPYSQTGVMYIDGTNPSVNIKNSILWSNQSLFNSAIPVITYSIVQGGYAGTGNQNTDPLFANPSNPIGADGVWGSADDGFRFQSCSPGVNTGDNAGVTGTDFAGSTRIFNTTVDMGAYELQSTPTGNNTYYRDMDSDGFGNPSVTQMACSQPGGYVANNTDCNDNNALEKPGQVWYKDTDNDGYAQTGTATITQCLRPTGYKAASELTSTTGDCNDNNAAIKPGATEVCDGIDNNCNGSTDEGVQTTYYRDMDSDGFGNPSVTQMACSQPSGYVTNNTDCNDNSALEKPGQVWYKDTDNDGYAQTGAATIIQCLRPTGYKAASELTSTTGDCNDNNAGINPTASEVCDGVDNNCNSSIDEGVQTTYYRDMDMDGFGNPSVTQMACSQPSGYVANNTDCNDNSALEKPGQIWYKDTDNDGYAQTGAATITQCLRPSGYKAASELTSTTGDCNDNNAAINPAVSEICDGIDNNCNSMTDEGAQTTYYRDMDNDGFGNPSVTQMACSQPSGYVTNNTDCNDNNALEKPGQVWYKDTDNDGYAQTGAATITQCLRPTGYKAALELTSTTGDCNDNNAAINPVASEVCDGVDNNCNSSIDEGVQTTYYRDMDNDGFGNPSVTQMACSLPSGYVTNNTDCNDNSALEKPGQVWYKDTDNDGYAQTGAATITQCLRPTGYKAASELTSTTGDCNDNNAAINPAVSEVCDGVDNNCNGSIDEGVLTTYYRDMDNDGFGNPSVTQMACSQPTGYVSNSTDCDDSDATAYPGGEEVCDSKDNDCNNVIDDIGGTTAGNWQNANVGGSNGSANFPPCNALPNDVFTINATGFSTSSSDNIQAVYQELCGNGEIVARVLNVSGGGWAGIMLRETLNPGSKKVALKMQGNNYIRREIRMTTNGAVSSLNYFRPQHIWLRLVRNGSTFVGYSSTDGINWSYAFSATIPMNGCIYAGLFSESINVNVMTTATFDNVTITKPDQTLSNPGVQPVASNGLKPELDVDVFPNPTDGRLTVDLSAYANKATRLEIYDNLGKVLKIVETESMNVQLDLSAYQNGLYQIRVTSEGMPDVTKRVVLVR